MSNLLLIVSGIGAVQCILFVLLISIKKRRGLSDWILAVWFCIFFAHLLVGIFNEVDPTHITNIFIMSIGFLHGPMFLVYTKSVFEHRFAKIDLVHFAAFLGFTIIGFFISSTFETKWEIIVLLFKLISLSIYPIYILFYYKKEHQAFGKSASKFNRHGLSWIKVVAILFLLSLAISLIRLAIELLVGVAYFELWDLLRYVVLVTIIGFFGLKYGMVYRPEVSTNSGREKYVYSPLKKSTVATISKNINDFFKESSIYLRSDFSLALLSERLGIPKHHLSQVINSEMSITFYELVNTKRVEYAMFRIREGGSLNISLEGLGYECGFNSKSAFFQNFKKITGKTPGQFKKEISTD